MADSKEVHFFDNEDAFAHGAPDYACYHARFSPQPGQKMTGEVTPIYMYWHDAPRRIWEYNPEMRIIVLLRNPVERAYSHWNMERARGAESLSFPEAIRRERERCRESLPLQHRVYSYIDRGFYAEQLRRLWCFFPERQVLAIKSEDLQHSPRLALRRIWRFLGLTELPHITPVREHAREYPAAIDAESSAYLLDVFEYPVRELERLLDWDCSSWLQMPATAG